MDYTQDSDLGNQENDCDTQIGDKWEVAAMDE